MRAGRDTLVSYPVFTSAVSDRTRGSESALRGERGPG